MTRTSVSDKARQRGFSLLELMLVLGILGMAALLITPGLSSLDAPGFNAQVREAGNLLNHARRSAVVQGQTTRIVFYPRSPVAHDEAATSTTFTTSDSANGRTPVRTAETRQWVARDMILVYRDSTGATNEVEERLDIEFYPEGGSSGGELRFVQGNRQVSIHVDPFSGRVQVRHEN